MPYAEKRDGKLTGRYISELRTRGFPKRAFGSKKEALGYEAYVTATGEEPANIHDNGTVSGHTFRSVAQELKDAGGPEGTWARGKDPSVISRLNTVCGMAFGGLAIEAVTFGEAEKVILNLAKRPGHTGDKLSPGTLNRYLTAISSVMTYAEQKGYIPRAPNLPWRKEVKKRQTLYSDTMLHAAVGVLKAEGKPVDAFLVEVLAIGGLRVGELLNARPEQIEDGFVSLDDPEAIKNEHPREVYIGEENADKLRVLIRENGLPTYQQLYNHLKSALKKCGYDVKRPIHALRHTRATRTVAEEADIQMAQELLGHKSIQTTLGYRQISKQVRRERAKKLHPQRGELPQTGEIVPMPHTIGKPRATG